MGADYKNSYDSGSGSGGYTPAYAEYNNRDAKGSDNGGNFMSFE